jgi:Domain of unknown function DUF29
MTDAKRLYNEDFALWSKEQANALRVAAHGGSNQRLDQERPAEEIEDLGASQRAALGSHIMRTIQHPAKLEHSRSSLGGDRGERSASPGCTLKDGSRQARV